MKRFEIKNFIENVKTMDYLQLLEFSQKEAFELDSINITQKSPLKEHELKINQFKKFISEFNFILINGIRPSSIDKDHLHIIKPIGNFCPFNHLFSLYQFK